MKNKYLLSVAAALASCVMLTSIPVSSSFAEGEAIVDDTFDNGEVGKWGSFGGGSVAIDRSAAQSGDCSIKVTGREKSYQGPSIQCDGLFIAGETYNCSGWIYHEGTDTVTMSWTLKYTDSIGTDSFAQIASTDVPPNEWVELANPEMFIPEETSGFRIYFESSDPTLDFNIDSVYISGKKADEGSVAEKVYEDKYTCDFEDDLEGWTARGDLRVVHTDEKSQSGTYSIYCSNRSTVWNGPQYCINDKIIKGNKYFYSAYVLYDGDEYEDEHVFRLEVQYTLDGSDHYDTVMDKKLKKGKWTKLSGYHTVPEGAENIYVYVQTDNLEQGVSPSPDDLMSFYVDNVEISKGEIVEKATKRNIMIIIILSVVAAAALAFGLYKTIKRTLRNNAAIENASIDAMTKMFNRNAYEKRIKEFEEDPELCSAFYFGLFDVNFLKYINDNFGHEKGDEAITRCAQMLRRVVGKAGDIYRTGGDEFICISRMPIDKKIKEAAAAESEKDNGYPFAVACGFAEYNEKELPDIKSIINKCDEEMYIDKKRIKAENKDFSRK